MLYQNRAHTFLKAKGAELPSRLGLNEFFYNFLVVFHWIDPPKNSQKFVEKAHYPESTPLKISIRTHSIPAWAPCLPMIWVESLSMLVSKFEEVLCVIESRIYAWFNRKWLGIEPIRFKILLYLQQNLHMLKFCINKELKSIFFNLELEILFRKIMNHYSPRPFLAIWIYSNSKNRDVLIISKSCLLICNGQFYLNSTIFGDFIAIFAKKTMWYLLFIVVSIHK